MSPPPPKCKQMQYCHTFFYILWVDTTLRSLVRAQEDIHHRRSCSHRPAQTWSTLVEGGKERYRPPGKLTLELVLANQKNKLLCIWTMQLTKWAGKVPYLFLLMAKPTILLVVL